MNLHAIDLPQIFGQRRVDGVESPRHRADAVTETTSRRWRVASEIRFPHRLQGALGKMSASNTDSAVFLTDSDDEIRRKIMTHAFSGGRETAKLQRELGADLDIDVAYQWLRFFLEDDEELDAIGKSYGSGQGPYWNTAAVKVRLVVELQKLVRAHKARRDVPTGVEINQCVGCLAPSSGEEPASPRDHRAGVASMAWRSTRQFSTNAP